MNLVLRRQIDKSGKSIKEVAEHCGKTPQTFNSYLNGSQHPTIKTLELLSLKLECTVFELIECPAGFDHVYTSGGAWVGVQKISK